MKINCNLCKEKKQDCTDVHPMNLTSFDKNLLGDENSKYLKKMQEKDIKDWATVGGCSRGGKVKMSVVVCCLFLSSILISSVSTLSLFYVAILTSKS